MSYTETRQFNINSRNGVPIDGNLTSYTNLYYNIPGFLSPDNDVLFTTLSILSFSCSSSWLLVNSYNNQLNLYHLGDTRKYILIDGCYNAITFIAMVAKVLPPEFSMTFNINTGCFQMVYQESFLTFDFMPSSSYMLFGAPKDQILQCQYAGVLDFPLPANLSGPSRIVISSDIQTRNFDVSLNSSFFCSIDVNVPSYETVSEENVNVNMLMPSDYFLNGFSLSLSDENGIPLNLRGVPYFLTIEVKYTRTAPLKSNGLRAILNELANIIQTNNLQEEKDDEEIDQVTN